MYGYQGKAVRAGSAQGAVKVFCRRAAFIEKSAANNSIFRLFRAGAGAGMWVQRMYPRVQAVPRGRGRGAFALWLACHTQEEIAAAVDMSEGAISEWEDDFRKKLEVDIFLNSADFEVPIYNVWKQQTKTRRNSVMGR